MVSTDSSSAGRSRFIVGLKRWLFAVFMIRHVQTGLRAFLLFLAKIWNFVVFVAKKEARIIVQHQAVRYDLYPLSPITRHRLSTFLRKYFLFPVFHFISLTPYSPSRLNNVALSF